VYFADDEMKLLDKIDADRSHISRSGWMKQAAEEKLKKSKEQPRVLQDININSDIFKDNI
jgi:hypothetical protein